MKRKNAASACYGTIIRNRLVFCRQQNDEECTETVIITVPQSGYLRDLYLNNYKLFVNTVGGAPTMQVSSCNVHTAFGTITPTPGADETPDPQATNVPEMTQPPTQ